MDTIHLYPSMNAVCLVKVFRAVVVAVMVVVAVIIIVVVVVVVIVDFRFVFASFNSLDPLQTLLDDK